VKPGTEGSVAQLSHALRFLEPSPLGLYRIQCRRFSSGRKSCIPKGPIRHLSYFISIVTLILTFPLHEHGEHSCGLQVEVP